MTMFAVVHENGNRRIFNGIFSTEEKAREFITKLQVYQEWMRSAYKIVEVPVDERKIIV